MSTWALATRVARTPRVWSSTAPVASRKACTCVSSEVRMILTTLNPTTLIIGKVTALFMVGLVQMLTFALPVIVAYVFFRSNLKLPDVDLSTLSLQPEPMIVGVLLLVGGFIVFTGTLVAIGAVVPTVKEAGTAFAPLTIMLFLPFYVVSMIVSDPSAPIVQVFTYFPYTAPGTAMLRNGFGSLSSVESALVISELFIFGIITLRLAVHLFRYGSLEYSKKLSIRNTFQRRSHAESTAVPQLAGDDMWSDPVLAGIEDQVRAGHEIKAAQMYCKATGVSVGEAKLAIDSLRERAASPAMDRHLGPDITLAGPAAAALREHRLDPEAVSWLQTNFLKTELELGHCLRTPAEGPCECDLVLTCSKFLTTSYYAPRLRARMEVEQQLIDDATARNWPREIERHEATKRRLDRLLYDLA